MKMPIEANHRLTAPKADQHNAPSLVALAMYCRHAPLASGRQMLDSAQDPPVRDETPTFSAGPSGRRRPSLRPSAVVAGAAMGATLTLLAAVVILLVNRNPLPLLTLQRLDAAEALWQRRGPDNYDLEIVISGRASGNYQVEVRDGRAAAVRRNGVSPRRATWDSWTVEGLFGFMREELEHVRDPAGFNAPAGTQVVLRAEFDDRFGYPKKYERAVLEESLDIDVQWQVTRFSVKGNEEPQ